MKVLVAPSQKGLTIIVRLKSPRRGSSLSIMTIVPMNPSLLSSFCSAFYAGRGSSLQSYKDL